MTGSIRCPARSSTTRLGGLADRYGRGLTTAIACLLVGLALLGYGFSRELYQFLLLEFVAALGAALYSGAFVAWLVDALREEGRRRELARVLGTARAIALLVSAVCAFLGGAVAEYGLELPFLAGAVSGISASLLALLLTRGRGEALGAKRKRYREVLNAGARVLFGTKPLVLLTVGSLFVLLGIPCFALTWAPHMESLGASRWLLGLAGAVFMLVMGGGSYVGGRLVKRLGYRKTVVTSLTLMSLSLALLAIVNDPYSFIAAALFFEVGYGSLRPTLTAWINEYVPSSERVTVLSLRRTVTLPFSAIGMIITGALSDFGSPRLAYVFGLVAIAAAIPAYLKTPPSRGDGN